MKSLVIQLALFLLVAAGPPEKVQRGIALLNQGDIDGATALFQEVIQAEPNHGPARFFLGQIAMDRNQWAQAEEHLRFAVASGIRRPHLAWSLLGKLQLQQHRYEEARNSYRESLQQEPAFEPALAGRARASLFVNDVPAALSDLERATSPEGVLLHAELLVYLDRDADAVSRLEKFAFTHAAHEKAAKHLLASLGDDPLSENELVTHLSTNLGDAQAYVALAIWKQRHGAMNPALFEIAFELEDQNPIPLLFLKKHAPGFRTGASLKVPLPDVIRSIGLAGNALKQKQWSQAREAAGRILEERPFHIPAELILIEAAEQEENYWEALEHYQKVLAWLSIPSIESRVANLGKTMGAYDLAECHARRALQAQPRDGYLHYVLAGILQARKKTAEALQESHLSIESGFQAAPAYVLLGNLYYENMDIPESIAALQKAVEIDPHAAENIAAFALSALTAADYQALRGVLEAHVKANPENIGTLYSLALMHMNENRLEEARSYLMRLEKLAPEHLQVPYNLGLVSFRLGLEEEGRKAMDRFQELKEKELRDWVRHNDAFKTRLEAQDALRHKNFEESIQLYSQLSATKLAEPEDLVALAESYRMIEKHAQALEFFEEALKAAPVHREALEGAARAAKALGKDDLARLYGRRLDLISKPCL